MRMLCARCPQRVVGVGGEQPVARRAPAQVRQAAGDLLVEAGVVADLVDEVRPGHEQPYATGGGELEDRPVLRGHPHEALRAGRRSRCRGRCRSAAGRAGRGARPGERFRVGSSPASPIGAGDPPPTSLRGGAVVQGLHPDGAQRRPHAAAGAQHAAGEATRRDPRAEGREQRAVHPVPRSPYSAVWSTISPTSEVVPSSGRATVSPSNQADHARSRGADAVAPREPIIPEHGAPLVIGKSGRPSVHRNGRRLSGADPRGTPP